MSLRLEHSTSLFDGSGVSLLLEVLTAESELAASQVDKIGDCTRGESPSPPTPCTTVRRPFRPAREVAEALCFARRKSDMAAAEEGILEASHAHSVAGRTLDVLPFRIILAQVRPDS